MGLELSDVNITNSIEVATKLVGKPPRGYRAPLYTVRESTIKLLREHKFLYDSSLMHHDSQVYFAPSDPPIKPIDLSKPAASWFEPSTIASQGYPHGQHPLVEIPCTWYNEDMTPLQYLPRSPKGLGYISTAVVEQMWKDKFIWLYENEAADFVFPVLLHPDTSGLAHVIGMIDRFIQWLKAFGSSVEFCTCEQVAAEWLAVEKKKAGQA